MILISVDLPAPLSPTIACTSLDASSKLPAASATTRPKCFWMPRASSSGKPVLDISTVISRAGPLRGPWWKPCRLRSLLADEGRRVPAAGVVRAWRSGGLSDQLVTRSTVKHMRRVAVGRGHESAERLRAVSLTPAVSGVLASAGGNGPYSAQDGP